MSLEQALPAKKEQSRWLGIAKKQGKVLELKVLMGWPEICSIQLLFQPRSFQ